MFELALVSLKIRFNIAVNRLLFFIKRIPGIKHVVSPHIYGDYAFKDALAILGAICVALKKATIHFLYMLLVLAIGMFVSQVRVYGSIAGLFASDNIFAGMTAQGVVNYALYAWFIMSIVFAAVCSVSAEYNNVKNDDIMLNYFRTNPNLYAKTSILFDRIVHILLVTPFLIIAFIAAGMPIWGVFITLVMLTGFRLAGEAIQLIMYRYLPIHFARPWLNNTASFVMLVAAINIPVLINLPNIFVILANPIVALVSIPIGYFSWIYIRQYKLFGKLQAEKINWFNNQVNKYKSAQVSGNTASGMNFYDAKKWSKSINTAGLESEKDKYKSKTGFTYLNAIFFDRHSKFFRNKLFKRSLFFILLPVVLLLFSTVLSVTGEETFLTTLNIQDTGLTELFEMAPFFFFLIYVLSMGRAITASVFTNCDINMLHYRYYRTRETIFASFKARLKVVLRYNIIITTIMSISLIAAVSVIYGYMDWLYAAVFFALLTAIGVFFAFNDLFLYYVIQPYDSAGKGKSIIYTIINYAIYVVAWINFSLRLDFIAYSIAIGIATFLYFTIGTVLLLLLAPKRFKLR